MTVHEVMSEIRHLSVEDRMQLLKLLKETLGENGVRNNTSSAARRLRGVLRPDGQIPTDEELASIYPHHLMGKFT